MVNNSKIKNFGYGRNEKEAIKTSLFNLVDQLLEEEKFFKPIKESLKIFNQPQQIKKLDISENTGHLNSSFSNFQIINENTIFIPSEKEYSNNFKEILEEKNLIIIELEKLVVDIMSYNKVIFFLIRKYD